MKRTLRSAVAFELGWGSLCVLALALDCVSGPRIQFPVLLLVPLSLAAWRHGRWALLLVVPLAAARIIFRSFVWHAPMTVGEHGVNALIRIAVFAFVAGLVATVAKQKRELEKEIHTLHGILPICMFCKKIRASDGRWEQLETYVSRRSEARFSHGLCDECARKNYGGSI